MLTRAKPKALKPKPISEAVLQGRITGWMRHYLAPPPEGPYWTAINPVPSKSLRTAITSKQLGAKAGIGDLLLVHRGRAISLELKAAKGRPSPVQEQFKREWLLAGGLHAYIYSFEQFIQFIDMLDLPVKAGGLQAAEALGV